MRMLSFVAISLGLAAPLAAQSGGTVLSNPEFVGGFANKGTCTAALAKVRNEARKDPSRRGGAPYTTMSGSEYNKASLTTTRCELRNGRYVVVYYSNGF